MPGSWYRWQNETLILDVSVQPSASRDEIVGSLGDRLKIRLTAPPVDGKANQQLLKYLAALCGVGRKQVRLLSGAGSRTKCVAICAPRILPDGVEWPKT